MSAAVLLAAARLATALSAIATSPSPAPARPAATMSVPVPPAPPPSLSPPAPAAYAAPAASAIIVPDRPTLVLGAEQDLSFTVEIHGADAAGLRLDRALASVGTIQDLAVAGADRFRGRYVAPATRYPQVAILVVDLVAASGGQRVRAAATLPLAAATEIPFRTSPRAGVTMRIADRLFGPVRADEQGRVRIPVVVPPGVRDGIARAADRFGSTRETAVDLQPAPFNRLLVVAAAEAEAGSFVEISVFSVDPRGAPAGAGQIALAASDGLIHPLGPGAPGEERFLLEAPGRVAAGPIGVVATMTAEALGASTRGGAGGTAAARAEAEIALVPGPARKLLLGAPTEPLIIGEGGRATVTVAARDRLDNPASCKGAMITIDGAPGALELLPHGDGAIRVPAPARFTGKREIAVEASLNAAHGAAHVGLMPSPAARLAAVFAAPRLVADGRNAVDVRVDVLDRRGAPTVASALRWQAAGGRIAEVTTSTDGTYVARFIPNRARDPHTETLLIAGDPPLAATATLAVEPPRTRAVLTARVGLFSNLGSSAGPAASLEALSGIPGHTAWAAGVVVSYLRNDLTSGAAAAGLSQARLELDQFPILAVARYHLPLPFVADVTIGAGVGISLATVEITAPPVDETTTTHGNAHALALEGGGDVAFPLAPGELVVGAHYLWVDLGRTSHGDQIDGNSAGLVGDIGFRIAW